MLSNVSAEELQQMIILRPGKWTPKIFKKSPYRHLSDAKWPTDMTGRYTDIVNTSKLLLYQRFGTLIDAHRQQLFLEYLAQELILLTKHKIFTMDKAILTRIPFDRFMRKI